MDLVTMILIYVAGTILTSVLAHLCYMEDLDISIISGTIDVDSVFVSALIGVFWVITVPFFILATITKISCGLIHKGCRNNSRIL